MVVVPAVPVEACLIPPEIMSISSAVGAGAVVVVGTVVVAGGGGWGCLRYGRYSGRSCHSFCRLRCFSFYGIVFLADNGKH